MVPLKKIEINDVIHWGGGGGLGALREIILHGHSEWVKTKKIDGGKF